MAVAFLVKKDQRSALESVERGLAIRRKALGDEHYLTLQSMGNVSEMYLRFGRCPEARPLLAQVIRVRELKKIPTLAGALAIQADCDAAEGKLPQAVEGYQRAIALYEAQEGRKAQIGVMRFHLAKALWDLGRRKEARAAALRARDELGGGSDRAEKREALDAWLASHSR
jgi:tetratricopeptide (TPR) repeat protein